MPQLFDRMSANTGLSLGSFFCTVKTMRWNLSVRCLSVLLFVAMSAGCSIKKYAINQVGDILASGGSIYESDEDIEFDGQALPFSLKLVESLIEESPKDEPWCAWVKSTL